MYKKKTGKDVRKDNRAVQKLRREVEKAKRALSSQHQARIEIESFFDGEDFSETLTRARFEELNMVSTQTALWFLKDYLTFIKSPLERSKFAKFFCLFLVVLKILLLRRNFSHSESTAQREECSEA